jgi:hypothetical protein
MAVVVKANRNSTSRILRFILPMLQILLFLFVLKYNSGSFAKAGCQTIITVAEGSTGLVQFMKKVYLMDERKKPGARSIHACC